MINLVSLLFTLGAVAFVTIRAAMFDKLLPWFQPVPKVMPRFIRKRPTGRQP